MLSTSVPSELAPVAVVVPEVALTDWLGPWLALSDAEAGGVVVLELLVLD